MIKKRFEMEVEREIKNKYTLIEKEIPPVLNKYLEHCGIPPDPENIFIRWADSRIRRGNRWMDIDMIQFNTPAPFRSVYIRGGIFGIPVEGLDMYSNGQGEMTIKALKFLRVAEDRGPEMDRSALVTALSEAPLLPSIIFAECTEWAEVDEYTVEARIQDHGIKVGGLFSFDDQGRFIKFYTEDRYCAEFNMERHPWSVDVLSYLNMGGFQYPWEFTATWHLPDGDLKYFHGKISDVNFNIRHFK